ncbi:ribose 5-phosphate isomerase B [Breznakibacter xylanolyticus]|uniref:Ribose 5-phosphate isomerase B n=1 Tax=Breznakibacter xylanolyticus TaxID=990 RepID=A0A2W7P1V2_9BACT|nr:ribose 5-phosphate isomerase B [Breznakibacter xylanolyticus]PZX19406.1 ribose 5-phosphate isomerase B [Breznakibacter xylanolyticus]
MKTIALASDHAGFDLKEKIKVLLTAKGYTFIDFGTNSAESCDYADYAHPMADSVEKGDCDFGISVCGSGNGINMTVNKHQGIRAALCWNSEISSLARSHNNANICSLPARFISEQEAFDIVDAFMNTGFEGGRHQTRIDKIPVKK